MEALRTPDVTGTGGPPGAPPALLAPGAIGPRLARAAGVAGLVFAVLFTVTFVLIRVGMPPEDPGAFATWWASSRDRVAIGVYLMPFAGMAFIWFVAAVRRKIGSAEGLFFSTIFLGSALVFVALLFVTGAAVGAVIAAEQLEPDRLQIAAALGISFGYELFFGFTVRMAAMFMLAVASIGRTTAALPRAIVLLTLVLGLVALVGNSFVEPFALIFPAWVALVSLTLVRQPSA